MITVHSTKILFIKYKKIKLLIYNMDDTKIIWLEILPVDYLYAQKSKGVVKRSHHDPLPKI